MYYCRYILILGAVIAACSESPTANRASVADLDIVVPKSHLAPIEPLVAVPGRMYVLSDNAPPELPPEFQQSVWLDVTAGAWFDGTSAKGSSIVDYLATNATAKVILTIRKGVAQMGVTPPAEAQESDFLPWSRQLVARTEYSMADIKCGHSATSSAVGSAWNQAPFFPTWFRWGDATKSAQRVADQAPCPPPPPPSDDPESNDGSEGGGGGGGTGGGGSEWEVCYYTAVYEGDRLVDIEEHGCTIVKYPDFI